MAALVFSAAVILAVHSSLSSASPELSVDPDMAGLFTLGLQPEGVSSSDSKCTGSVVECSVLRGEGNVFAMDSEINRRILAVTRYISHGALRRNVVPCSRRGASYYKRCIGAQANPYSRRCIRITRCRG